jgi:hypothetical protein
MSSINIEFEKDFESTFSKIKQVFRNMVFFPTTKDSIDNDLLFGHTCAKCGSHISNINDELEVVDADDVSLKKMYFHKHHFS